MTNNHDEPTANFWACLRDLLTWNDEDRYWSLACLFEDRVTPEMAVKIRSEAAADTDLARILDAAFELSIEAKLAFGQWLWLSTPEGVAKSEQMDREYREDYEARTRREAALTPEQRAERDARYAASDSDEILF